MPNKYFNDYKLSPIVKYWGIRMCVVTSVLILYFYVKFIYLFIKNNLINVNAYVYLREKEQSYIFIAVIFYKKKKTFIYIYIE